MVLNPGDDLVMDLRGRVGHQRCGLAQARIRIGIIASQDKNIPQEDPNPKPDHSHLRRLHWLRHVQSMRDIGMTNWYEK